MRCVALIISLLLAGCARSKLSAPGISGQADPVSTAGVPAQTNKPSLIVTPNLAVKGKVAMVNPNARYAIITFPIGQMPPAGARLNVFRAGLKVGEIQTTGLRQDINVAADIMAGECQVGDEVRAD